MFKLRKAQQTYDRVLSSVAEDDPSSSHHDTLPVIKELNAIFGAFSTTRFSTTPTWLTLSFSASAVRYGLGGTGRHSSHSQYSTGGRVGSDGRPDEGQDRCARAGEDRCCGETRQAEGAALGGQCKEGTRFGAFFVST
jgi:hypothetical protein